MKNLKLLILVFGICGLAGLFIPVGGMSMFKLLMEFDKLQLVLMLAAFGVPAVMGAMGMAKPPFMAWQGALATAGFALAAIKLKIWEAIPHIADGGIVGVLLIVGTVGGLIVSIMSLVKPEKA